MMSLGSQFWPSLLILVSFLVVLLSRYPDAIFFTSSPISFEMVLGILPAASHRSKPYFKSGSINTSLPRPVPWGDVLQRLHSFCVVDGIVHLQHSEVCQVYRVSLCRKVEVALTNGRI